MVTSHRSTRLRQRIDSRQCPSIVPQVSLSLFLELSNSLQLYVESFLSLRSLRISFHLFSPRPPPISFSRGKITSNWTKYIGASCSRRQPPLRESSVLAAFSTTRGMKVGESQQESWQTARGGLESATNPPEARFIYALRRVSPARDARRGKIGQSCWRTYNYFISALSPLLISTMVRRPSPTP